MIKQPIRKGMNRDEEETVDNRACGMVLLSRSR